MIVIVDKRELVIEGYVTSFSREGVSSTGFEPCEFKTWLGTTPKKELKSVEAYLIGECPEREMLPPIIKAKTIAPVIAMSEDPSLNRILQLFSAGVDDVVRKPVHVREILARVNAILSRQRANEQGMTAGEIKIFPDGRPPMVGDMPLQLPRREYRILHYLVQNRDKRVTKSQLFDCVYGIFEDNVEESVIESHISKLRKKLRNILGYDPIDSRRYLGYCLHSTARKKPARSSHERIRDASEQSGKSQKARSPNSVMQAT